MEWLELIGLYVGEVAQLNWQLFTLIALLVYGYFQYSMDASLSAFRKELGFQKDEVATRSIINYMMCGSSAMVAILCGTYSLYQFEFGDRAIQIYSLLIEALIFGLLQGILFFLVQYSRFMARSGGYSREFVHSASRLNIFIVLLFGFFVLGEADEIKDSMVQLVLIAISIYLLSGKGVSIIKTDVTSRNNNQGEMGYHEKNVIGNTPLSLPMYLMIAIVASACIQILSKYAVGTTNIDIVFFIFVSNVFTLIGAMVICYKTKIDLGENYNVLSNSFIKYYKKGMVLGVVNLIAFLSLLMALSMKGAGVVIPLYSLYILVPILFNTLIDGHKLTERVTLASMLSILAIFVATQN